MHGTEIRDKLLAYVACPVCGADLARDGESARCSA